LHIRLLYTEVKWTQKLFLFSSACWQVILLLILSKKKICEEYSWYFKEGHFCNNNIGPFHSYIIYSHLYWHNLFTVLTLAWLNWSLRIIARLLVPIMESKNPFSLRQCKTFKHDACEIYFYQTNIRLCNKMLYLLPERGNFGALCFIFACLIWFIALLIIRCFLYELKLF
jgi:hypothetical protein